MFFILGSGGADHQSECICSWFFWGEVTAVSNKMGLGYPFCHYSMKGSWCYFWEEAGTPREKGEPPMISFYLRLPECGIEDSTWSSHLPRLSYASTPALYIFKGIRCCSHARQHWLIIEHTLPPREAPRWNHLNVSNIKAINLESTLPSLIYFHPQKGFMKFLFWFRVLFILTSLPQRSNNPLLAQWESYIQSFWMDILWKVLEHFQK